MLALGVQLGLGLLGQGDPGLLRPLAHHGIEHHCALSVLHGVLAVGQTAADGGVKVHGAHIGGQIVAIVGQPVEVFLGGHGSLVHGHQGSVRMDAAGLIKYAVGTLAVGHIAHQCYAGHQKNGGQQTGQCADDEFFHVISPSVLGAWPFISSVPKKSFRPAA